MLHNKRFMLVTLLLVVALLAGSVAVLAQGDVQLGPITQAILDRGELICGVNQAVAGFGIVNDAGEFSGFDVDFCRAVAVAILGDANAVSFRPLSGTDRQAAIQSGEVDMISRNTTWTLSRDVVWGATFGPTTFYDGQGIMVTAASGFTTIEELDGLDMCVQSGTTTELNITDAFTSRGLSINLQTFPDAASTWEGYIAGRCDAWTTDKSGLVSYQATAEDPGAHYILEITLSKEPLGPLTPQSDPQFADIVRWVAYGQLIAEEFGITSENVGDFMDSDNPEIQRLLGIGDNVYYGLLGINNQAMVDVITQVGNYGEVFARNLGVAPFNLERGLNALWTDGGLMYAPPVR